MRLTIENILFSLRELTEDLPGCAPEDMIEHEAADLIEELLAVIRLYQAGDPGADEAARKVLDAKERILGTDPFRG